MVTTMLKSLLSAATLVLISGPIALSTPLMPRLIYLKYQDGTQLSINCTTWEAAIAGHPPVEFDSRSVAAQVCRVAVLQLPEVL